MFGDEYREDLGVLRDLCPGSTSTIPRLGGLFVLVVYTMATNGLGQQSATWSTVIAD